MFGKHFESMYTGSMLGAGAVTFAVWGYVISHARYGKVELNSKLLSVLIGESEGNISDAIMGLCSPDPKSRSKEREGRRLVRVGEYEYEVVNAHKYRSIESEEQRRERTRERVRKHRVKSGETGDVTPCNASVTHGNASNGKQKQKQKQSTDTESETKKEVPANAGFHKEFISGWSEAYKERFGEKYLYQGQDSKAVTSLSAVGTKDELLATAKSAWGRDGWNCKNRSRTIHGFYNALNEIRLELKQASAPITKVW